MFNSKTMSQKDVQSMYDSGNAIECLFLEIAPERIQRARRIDIARSVVRYIVKAIVVVTTVATSLQLFDLCRKFL